MSCENYHGRQYVVNCIARVYTVHSDIYENINHSLSGKLLTFSIIELVKNVGKLRVIRYF